MKGENQIPYYDRFTEYEKVYDNAYGQLIEAVEKDDEESAKEALYVMLRHAGSK